MWYVHKYEVRLDYGGPEEGGWWFTSGTPVESDWAHFPTERQANEACYAANVAERERRKEKEDYEFTSVLAYRSTHYEFDVSDQPVARAFPEHRPRYE